MPFANVFSIGDVLIGIGIAATIGWPSRCGTGAASDADVSHASAMTPRRAGRRAAPRSSSARRCVYLFLVLVLRMTGKREVGQMSILELIVILLISDAVQNSMVGDNTTLLGGLVAVLDAARARPAA